MKEGNWQGSLLGPAPLSGPEPWGCGDTKGTETPVVEVATGVCVPGSLSAASALCALPAVCAEAAAAAARTIASMRLGRVDGP